MIVGSDSESHLLYLNFVFFCFVFFFKSKSKVLEFCKELDIWVRKKKLIFFIYVCLRLFFFYLTAMKLQLADMYWRVLHERSRWKKKLFFILFYFSFYACNSFLTFLFSWINQVVVLIKSPWFFDFPRPKTD